MLTIEERLNRKIEGWNWKDLESLVLEMGYSYTSQSGSHRKYWHEVTKSTVILVTTSVHGFYDTVKELRKTWQILNPIYKTIKSQPIIKEKEPVMDWKTKIRSIRVQHNLSLKDVGDRMGFVGNSPSYSTTTMWAFEKDARKFFTKYEFELWCKVLNSIPGNRPLDSGQLIPIRNLESGQNDGW